MYYKIWFSNGSERTAKLVVNTRQFPLGTTMGLYSQLFPYSEAGKMKRFNRTVLYKTFDQAFNDDWAADVETV